MNRDIFHKTLNEGKQNLLLTPEACEEYLWNWGVDGSKYTSLLRGYRAVGEPILTGTSRAYSILSTVSFTRNFIIIHCDRIDTEVSGADEVYCVNSVRCHTMHNKQISLAVSRSGDQFVLSFLRPDKKNRRIVVKDRILGPLSMFSSNYNFEDDTYSRQHDGSVDNGSGYGEERYSEAKTNKSRVISLQIIDGPLMLVHMESSTHHEVQIRPLLSHLLFDGFFFSFHLHGALTRELDFVDAFNPTTTVLHGKTEGIVLKMCGRGTSGNEWVAVDTDLLTKSMEDIKTPATTECKSQNRSHHAEVIKCVRGTNIKLDASTAIEMDSKTLLIFGGCFFDPPKINLAEGKEVSTFLWDEKYFFFLTTKGALYCKTHVDNIVVAKRKSIQGIEKSCPHLNRAVMSILHRGEQSILIVHMGNAIWVFDSKFLVLKFAMGRIEGVYSCRFETSTYKVEMLIVREIEVDEEKWTLVDPFGVEKGIVAYSKGLHGYRIISNGTLVDIYLPVNDCTIAASTGVDNKELNLPTKRKKKEKAKLKRKANRYNEGYKSIDIDHNYSCGEDFENPNSRMVSKKERTSNKVSVGGDTKRNSLHAISVLRNQKDAIENSINKYTKILSRKLVESKILLGEVHREIGRAFPVVNVSGSNLIDNLKPLNEVFNITNPTDTLYSSSMSLQQAHQTLLKERREDEGGIGVEVAALSCRVLHPLRASKTATNSTKSCFSLLVLAMVKNCGPLLCKSIALSSVMALSTISRRSCVVSTKSGCVEYLEPMRSAFLTAIIEVEIDNMQFESYQDYSNWNGIQTEPVLHIEVAFSWKEVEASQKEVASISFSPGMLLVGLQDLIEIHSASSFASNSLPTSSSSSLSISEATLSSGTNELKRSSLCSPEEMKAQFETLVAKCDLDDLRMYSCLSMLPVKIIRRDSHEEASLFRVSFNSSMALIMLKQQLEASAVPISVSSCHGVYDDGFEVTKADFTAYVNSTDLTYYRNTLLVVPNLCNGNQDCVFGKIVCEDKAELSLVLTTLQSNLLSEFALMRCYDNELVFNTVQIALAKMLEEMKAISVAFRQLAHGLRNHIVSRWKNERNSIDGVNEYSTFFRKLNYDYSTHNSEGNDFKSTENDTIVLGPRVVTRKGLINGICSMREATDMALVEAFEACSIYETLPLSQM